MEQPEKVGQSRLDSLIGIVKAFLKIDPMMALIAIIIIVPLAIPIIQAVLAGDLIVTLTFIGLISGITLFVYIPLIIVRTYQKNQREISKKQQEAIDTEAEIRLINERNKQKRFNDVTDARLDTLKAQTQFILDQSDRHERVLLKQTAEDLGKHLKKGLPFVDKAEYTECVSNLLDEFQKIHLDYDEVQVHISRLEEALKIKKEDLPEIQITKAPDKPTSDDWEKIAELRQRIIEEQLKELDNLQEKFESQVQVIQKLETELNTTSEGRKGDIEAHLTITDAPVDEIKADPDRYKLKIIDTKEPSETELGLPSEKELENHFQKQMEAEPLPDTVEQEIDARLKELDEHDDLQLLEKSSISKQDLPKPLPEPEGYDDMTTKNYWTCKYCGNDNPLKAPRCKKCAKGKG